MSDRYVYNCEICDKKFKSRSGFTSHTFKNTCSDMEYQCKLCFNRFKRKDSLSHHKNNTCRVMRERKKEYNDILDIKKRLDLLEKELVNKNTQLIEKEKEIKLLQNNIIIKGDQNNINNNIHLHINPHGRENIDNIDFEEIVKMIVSLTNTDDLNLMIPNMIKKVNIETKENRNVYLPNIRANYGLILEDNTWNIKKIEPLLNDLVFDNVDRLDNFINNHEKLFVEHIRRDKYEELKLNINKYFDKISGNKENETECMNKIKDILITNRHIVSAFYEEMTGEKIKLPK